MRPWPIIKLTVTHCLIALAVSAIFGATLYALRYFYPSTSPIVWWFGIIDRMVQIIIMIALAVTFISSLFRIMADVILETWKGFLNGNQHFSLI